MSKNSLIYFVLFSLLQFLLVEINCLKPSQRYGHTTTFIDNKLYVLGGRFFSNFSINTLGREFFYLDFSTSFTTQNPLSWEDLSKANFVPQHSGAAAVMGGGNNSTLFLYGGETPFEKMAAVYTYYPKNNSWAIPNLEGYDGNDANVNGNNANRKAFLTGIVDDGKMYLWGGRELLSESYVNDMLILDTINLQWITGSSVNAPTPRSGYGAALFSNHKIIYMGGFNAQNIGLDEVYIYDTINDNWDTKKTLGNPPSNRQGFSAILALDGQRIIIFGGFEIDPADALHVLDLTDFKWYIPKISGNIPASRFLHKTDVIGNYMVVTFGIYDEPKENDVLLLNISNNEEYIWTTNFDPSGSSSSPSSPSSPKSKKSQNYKVVGIVGAFLTGGMLLTVGMFYLYKWKKARKNAINPSSVTLDKSVVLTMVNDNGQELKQNKK